MSDSPKDTNDTKFKPGQSGNPKGRPKGGVGFSSNISEEDREYFGTDSRKFLERALLKAKTWEEGLKIAKELRALQHASLQAIQTKTDTTHTIMLRWSTPEELASNEKSLVELSTDEYTPSFDEMEKELNSHEQNNKKTEE